MDYPEIVDGATLILEVPPRPPPVPPPLREWHTEHTLVGKLEGTQRREHRLLVWEEIIEEMDGLDILEPVVLQTPDKVEKVEEGSVDSEEEAAEVRRQVFQTLDTEGKGVLGREQVQRLVQEIDGTGARFLLSLLRVTPDPSFILCEEQDPSR